MKNKNAKNKKNYMTFFKVIRYLKVYRLHFFLTLFLTVISVGLTLYVPVLIGRAIDCAAGKGNVDFSGITSLLANVVFAILVTALLQWFIQHLNNKMTYGIVRNIRREAFAKIQHFPVSAIDRRTSGEVVSRIITDVEQFSDGLLMGFTQFFTGIATIAGTFIFMISINPAITLIVVFITPLSLFVGAFIAKRTYNMFKLQSEIRGEQTSLIDEMISGSQVVSAFGREEITEAEFDEINNRLKTASTRAIFYSSITNPSTRFVNGTLYAIVALAGALMVISGNGGLTVGLLSSFLMYSNQYTKPFNEISGVVTELQNALACAARVFELVEEPTEPKDAENRRQKAGR